LDANFSELWRLKLGRLSLVALFLELLAFDKGDVVVACHPISLPGNVPGSVGDLLHLQKCVGSDFVFNARILELFVKILLVVFFRVHQTDVFLQLLSE